MELELYPGVYQYKFVVDGEWMLATDKPSVLLNHQGAVNNVKIVKGTFKFLCFHLIFFRLEAK